MNHTPGPPFLLITGKWVTATRRERPPFIYSMDVHFKQDRPYPHEGPRFPDWGPGQAHSGTGSARLTQVNRASGFGLSRRLDSHQHHPVYKTGAFLGRATSAWFVAESEGVEPPRPLSSPVFKTGSVSSRIDSPFLLLAQAKSKSWGGRDLMDRSALLVAAPGVEPGSLAYETSVLAPGPSRT